MNNYLATQTKQGKQFISGENHLYLGKSYRLQLNKASETGVSLTNQVMTLNIKNPQSISHKEFVLDMWYRKQARLVFVDALAAAIVKAAPYSLTVPELKIHRLEKGWGLCSPKRKHIILNLDLIKTPKPCIDYIALHELLHFTYPNHNLSFYGALGNLMPDWKKREDLLNTHVF